VFGAVEAGVIESIMIFLETVVLFATVLLLAVLCGYGVVRLLLPEEYQQEFGWVIMPPVGYCVFSWVTFTLSGSFNLSGNAAAWVSLAILTLLAGFGWWIHRQRAVSKSLLAGPLRALGLSGPMLVCVLWPLFYVGAETYLAAVNPDYIATFFDLHHLKGSSLSAETVSHQNSYSYFETLAGNLSKSARFSSGYFVLLIDLVLPIATRTSLTLCIGLFMFSLPLSVYFMARTAFGLNPRAACLTSAWTGISGCVTMSFIYFYVGQNSGLGVLPTVLTLAFLLVTTPSWRTVVFATLMLNGLFAMYAGMLPYAAAPAGALALIQIVRHELKILTALKLAGAVLLGTVFLNLGILGFLSSSLIGWAKIVGQTLQGQYFLDFLTERFFPTFFGLVSYPVAASYPQQWFGTDGVLAVMTVLTVLAAGALGVIFKRWVTEEKNRAFIFFGLACALIYGAVWFLYTFQRQYGYAVFKMSSWLQFIYVLPLGYGLDWTLTELRQRKPRRALPLAVFSVLMVLLVGNLISSVRLTALSLGKDPVNGFIVNNYEMSGNYDYLTLKETIANAVRPGESIGISFVDAIQHEWISYYLRHFKLSWLGHYLIPGDDENLPDVLSRRVVDYYGNVRVDRNMFFHGATDQYILTTSPTHLNQEIVDQQLPQPLFEDQTFRLFRADQCKDFLYTGRGWYRLEYPRLDLKSWLPRRYRWSGEGGEVYMLHASKPNAPYRLSFVALAGYGYPTKKRTIELWHNGQKFDEVVIDGGARIISQPFYPKGDVELLVLKVRERVRPIPRTARLWNKEIPGDYRKLNILASDIKVYPADATKVSGQAHSDYQGNSFFENSLSFSGLMADRWVRDHLSIQLPMPAGSRGVEIRLSLPGQAGYQYPLEFDVHVNGQQSSVRVEKEGLFTGSYPIPVGTGALSTAELQVRPRSGFPSFDERNSEDDVRRLSFRLESIRFQ
jgi:hypothetical protein